MPVKRKTGVVETVNDKGSVFTSKDVEIVPIDSVHVWKNNPRKNDRAVPKLAKVLAIHGQRSPIVVWRKNNVVYKGNTTLKAARELSWKKIAVLWANFPSEQAAIAYAIADNKSSEFAEWDEDVLLDLLEAEELKGQPESTGFTEQEISLLFLEPDAALLKAGEAKGESLIKVIKLRCPIEQYEDLKKWVIKNLDSSPYTEVEVE